MGERRGAREGYIVTTAWLLEFACPVCTTHSLSPQLSLTCFPKSHTHLIPKRTMPKKASASQSAASNAKVKSEGGGDAASQSGEDVKVPTTPPPATKRKATSEAGTPSPSKKSGGWSGQNKAKLATFSKLVDLRRTIHVTNIESLSVPSCRQRIR